MKKPIALLMALAMSAAQIPMASFSNNVVYAAETDFTISLLGSQGEKSVTAKPGEEFSLVISMENNPGIIAYQFTLNYDTTAFTYVDCADLHDVMGFVIKPKVSKPGKYTVTWDDSVATENYMDNGDLVEVKFTVNEDAMSGTYPMNFTVDQVYDWEMTDRDYVTEVAEVKVVGGKKADYEGAIPAAPTVSNVTGTSFDVAVADGNEFTYSATEITDFSASTWSTDGAVTGLKPNTVYYVYQRVAETDAVNASDASAATKVTTSKLAIADIVKSVSIGTEGTAGTKLTPVITYNTGYTAADLGTVSYEWSNGAATADYTITAADVKAEAEISVTISSESVTGEVTSNKVTAGKAENTATVVKPVVKATEDGFVITAQEGYEYCVSETADLPENAVWTTETTVTGKKPGTTLYVFGRIAATDTVNASKASAATEVKIPNNNAELSALTVSAGTLSPEFSADTTAYKVTVPYGGKIAQPAVTLADENAKYELTKEASDFGANNVTEITVTAENGVDTKVYTVTYSEINAVLSDLTIDGAKVDGFSADKIAYTYEVSYDDWKADTAKAYAVAATAAKASSKVTISNESVVLDCADSDAGSSKDVTITVTDTENNTSVTYTITFKVLACEHANKIEADRKEPTCEAAGSSTDKCEACDKEFEPTEIPATGHDWDEGTVTTEPECEKDGVKTFVCKNDATHTKTEEVAMLGHDWSTEYTVDTAATCTTDGSKSRHCSRCDSKAGVTVIPATGHTWSEWVQVGETTEYARTCSACNKTESKIVTDTSHTHVFDGKTEIVAEATCTTEGTQKVWCSVEGCEEYVEESFAASHKYDTAWVNDATGHWHVCSVCNDKVAYSEHVENNGVVTIPATSTTEGLMTYSCVDCGYEMRTEVIEKVPDAHTHNYSAWNYTSTSHWNVCSCGETANYGGHTSDNGTVISRPTTTTDGAIVYKCSACGYTMRTVTLPATSPAYNPVIGNMPVFPSFIQSSVKFTEELNVKATAAGETVTLRWNEIEDAKSYIVYMANKNGRYVKVDSTNDTSIEIDNLKIGSEYKFRVRYVISGRVSPVKVSGNVTVVAGSKPGVSFKAYEDSIRLSWTKVPGAEKYAVYKIVDGKAKKICTTEKTAVRIKGLKSETEYQYIVRACVDGEWTSMTKSDIVTVETN